MRAALPLLALLAAWGGTGYAAGGPRELARIPAFPGAQGGGALSKGGRGGKVHVVSTLADSGPGSLRACVEASGPRTCVFRISGRIHLLSGMTVMHPHLTVAGQTAPGGGIALYLGTAGPRGGSSRPNQRVFSVMAHDVVLRYFRCWGDYIPGDTPNPDGNGSYCIQAWEGSRDLIVDHVSMLWQSGKAWQLWNGPGNTTVQWSILAEQVIGDARGQSTPAGTGNDSEEGARISDTDFHHNLFASASHRFPMLLSSSARIVNNVFYNWGWFASAVVAGGQYDFIGNYWKPGPLGPDSRHREIMAYGGRSDGSPSIYLSRNRSDWLGPGAPPDGGTRGRVGEDHVDGGWDSLTGGGSGGALGEGGPMLAGRTPLPESYKRTPWVRLSSPQVDITPGPVAELASVLTAPGGVGASQQLDCKGRWVSTRDGADARVIREFLEGTGPSRIPTSARSANHGSLPALATGTACVDTDRDGIPDEYEIAHGLDRRDPRDGATLASDGYTNLEHYLNGQ